MATSRDYYQVLDVARGATLAEIKKSYRALALELHPDKNPGDAAAEDRFKLVVEAYEVLSDPERRARYDRVGHAGMTAGGAAAAGFGSVSEVVEGLWNDLRGRRKRAAGRDLRYTLEIAFAEAALGCDKTITFPTRRDCETCDATGAREGGLRPCGTCGGSGQQKGGVLGLARDCSTCAGSGKVVALACAVCGGSGMRRIEREFTVHVPAGTRDGALRTVAREGEPGRRGGPPGDLHVVVRVRPHPLLVREGDDLLCELPVSFAEATLGAVIAVPTLDGVVKLRIPEGTQSGRLLRLRGKGLPHGGRGRGDQLVRVCVETPTELDSAARALLERFAEAARPPGPQRRRFDTALAALEAREDE